MAAVVGTYATITDWTLEFLPFHDNVELTARLNTLFSDNFPRPEDFFQDPADWSTLKPPIQLMA